MMSRRRLMRGTSALMGTSLISAGLPGHLGAATREITLDVREVDGRPTYNGLSPGPTIYAEPGDIIDVHLINSLPRLDDDCTDDPNAFHGLNTTNLHTHGLHVSPTTDLSGAYDADNVFVSVTPKGQFVPCSEVCGASVKTTFRDGEARYRFELPADHPTGTFWYHAHKHGSTFQQVGAGLSGPLILRDRPASMPDYIAAAEEKIFMIMNRGVVLVDPAGGGTLSPKIRLRPGEVQRWRVINARAVGNSFSYIRTGIPEIDMYLIAFDGLTLDRRVQLDTDMDAEPWLNPAALAPGNRADFMVRVPKDAEPAQSSLGILTELSDLLGVGPSTAPARIDIEIAGEPVDHPWSDNETLPGCGRQPFDATPLPTRSIRFSPGFTVDSKPYDGSIEHTVPLGSVEEWTIENGTGGVHAFHIHVNPFFITHINGEALPEGSPLRRWQDTIALPFREGDAPGSITCKTRFETYRGPFVIHCHILRHEDLGMMQGVEVV